MFPIIPADTTRPGPIRGLASRRTSEGEGLVSSKKLLLVLGLIIGGAREGSAQLQEVWTVALRPSALGREDGTAIAVDAAGNVYAAGSADQATPDDEASFVVLKYDPDGSLLWARTAGLGRVARPAAIAAHPLGGV